MTDIQVVNPFADSAGVAQLALAEASQMSNAIKAKAVALQNAKDQAEMLITQFRKNFIDMPATQLDWRVVTWDVMYRIDTTERLRVPASMLPDLKQRIEAALKLLCESDDTKLMKLYGRVAKAAYAHSGFDNRAQTNLELSLMRSYLVDIISKQPAIARDLVSLLRRASAEDELVALERWINPPRTEAEVQERITNESDQILTPEQTLAQVQTMLEKRIEPEIVNDNVGRAVAQALRPLVDRRKQHLEQVLKNLTPRQAA